MSRHGSSPEEEAKEEAPQSISPSAPALHTAFSSLKKEAIVAHTGLRNYERGLEYWQARRVRDRRAEGETISARCTGKSPEPYRIRASVVGGNRLRASCTCPVGSGGTCKHVAAVLVACALEPDTFVPADSIRDRLDSLSKDQLVHLFLTVLEHNPELDWVLETVGEGTQSGDDDALFDRFYSMAVAAVPNDMAWGATASAAQQLCDILAIADEFVDAGNSAGAAAVFQGVLRATLEAYHFLHDEGEISWVLVNSAKGIAACLPAFEPASARRKGLVDGLTDLMKLDVDMGGFGLSDDLPDLLATFATPDERGRIAAWLQRQMEAQNGDDHSAGYRRRHFLRNRPRSPGPRKRTTQCRPSSFIAAKSAASSANAGATSIYAPASTSRQSGDCSAKPGATTNGSGRSRPSRPRSPDSPPAKTKCAKPG